MAWIWAENWFSIAKYTYDLFNVIILYGDFKSLKQTKANF